jgi:hypothetical protein
MDIVRRNLADDWTVSFAVDVTAAAPRRVFSVSAGTEDREQHLLFVDVERATASRSARVRSMSVRARFTFSGIVGEGHIPREIAY